MSSYQTTARVVAAETEVEWLPRANETEGVILVRGFLADATFFTKEAVGHQLAEANFHVLSQNFSSGATWGNDTFLARMSTVVAWAEARWTKVHVLAVSMGGCDVLNWVRRNPGRLAGVCLVAPVCKLTALHDRDPGGLGASIESAYGGAAGWVAAQPNRDPFLWTEEHTRDQLQLWYSADDTVVIPSDVTEFASAVNIDPHEQGNVGHTLAGVDLDVVVDFFRMA